MSNVLITGSTGFLGSHLVSSYMLAGSPSRVITISRDGKPDINGAKTLHGDLCDYDFIRRVIADEEINVIYHCAANSIVRTCANDPLSAYEINVMATAKLLEAVRTVGMNNIQSIVISTSDKAMGHSPSPYTENSPLLPKYTYESTKSCQDIVAQNYFHNYGLPINIMRCSNIYGPADPNLSRIVPNTIRRVLAGQKPLLNKGVRNYIREFIYIADVVSAFRMVSEWAPAGEIYCVGGTGKTSIEQLILKIGQLINPEFKIDTGWVEYFERPEVFKEIDEQWIDSTKLRALGWKPSTSLEQGLKWTIDWYSKYGF